MKKALIVTTISGFVPQFELNNVTLLQQLGYEVHYASNFERPVYEFDPRIFVKKEITVHHLPIEKSPAHLVKNGKALLALCRLLRSERFDLIHCHNPMGGVLARVAGALCAPRTVLLYTAHGFHFYHGAPWRNWICYYPVERLLARATDFLITINEEDYVRAKRFSLKQGGCVWKTPGAGLDVGRFVPKAKDGRKERLGFPEDCFLLLSVGELNRNKNHQVVIRALAQLWEDNVCYGICGRGDQKEALEKLICRMGLQGRVKLLGYRCDIENVLPAADLFVFPSKREGFGMAAVEAMAAGLPVVAADCRGTREYMQDGVTGIVCRDGRPQTYREAILRLREDARERARMSRDNRQRALLFSREAAKNVMECVYARADACVNESAAAAAATVETAVRRALEAGAQRPEAGMRRRAAQSGREQRKDGLQE